jgi:tRNA(Arg) A34 adenosine deaminase TadA
MVFAPIPNREYHEGFMRKAIDMAELALASDETPVGCVFVHEGEVIGRGINGTNASLNVTSSLQTNLHPQLSANIRYVPRAPATPNSSP